MCKVHNFDTFRTAESILVLTDRLDVILDTSIDKLLPKLSKMTEGLAHCLQGIDNHSFLNNSARIVRVFQENKKGLVSAYVAKKMKPFAILRVLEQDAINQKIADVETLLTNAYVRKLEAIENSFKKDAKKILAKVKLEDNAKVIEIVK